MRYSVSGEEKGERIDVFLSEKTGKTRSSIAKAIAEGRVRRNGVTLAKAGAKTEENDVLEVEIIEPRPISAAAEDIPLEIIYEDEDIAVVNKPQGMVTHPASGSPSGTLVNALLYKISNLSGINGEIRPGIVHRLDKDTSGLLVIAKNDEAHLSLSKQISSKKARRYYYALVEGKIATEEGVIDTYIARSRKDRKKMAVAENGRRAITIYKVIAVLKNKTLVECELKTGRTHQIRVHMRSIGHPVVGDPLYGTASPLAPKGQLLHAHRLILSHPRTGEEMSFEAPINEDFRKALNSLGFQGEI